MKIFNLFGKAKFEGFNTLTTKPNED